MKSHEVGCPLCGGSGLYKRECNVCGGRTSVDCVRCRGISCDDAGFSCCEGHWNVAYYLGSLLIC